MTQRWIAIENNDNQDLHPENVEISLGRGQPKLIRFGIFGPERVENFPMVILDFALVLTRPAEMRSARLIEAAGLTGIKSIEYALRDGSIFERLSDQKGSPQTLLLLSGVIAIERVRRMQSALPTSRNRRNGGASLEWTM